MSDVAILLSNLLRGKAEESSPLFAPLVRSAACQIDAITPLELVSDPTLLGRGIVELARAGGLDVVFPATPCAMEVQALGADVSIESWPPRIMGPYAGQFSLDTDFDDVWESGELISCALECTTRLAQEGSGKQAIVAALTGPSTLLMQICNEQAPDEASREFVAAALAALVRKFGTAGADMIVLVEENPIVEDWTELYRTIGNTTKFLKKPLVIALDETSDAWPNAAVPQNLTKTISPDLSVWTDIKPDDAARVIVTHGEVAADAPLEKLLPMLEDLRYDMGA